jgi:hypothetical protein
MKVWAKPLVGERILLPLMGEEKVYEFKKKIINSLDLPVDNILLTYKGNTMLDNNAMNEYSLTDNSQLMVLYELREKKRKRSSIEGDSDASPTTNTSTPTPTPSVISPTISTQTPDIVPVPGGETDGGVTMEESNQLVGEREPRDEEIIAEAEETEGEGDLQFPAQEKLALLMAMGFPEWRFRKALFITLFDTEAAINWLLQHANDPTIDDPLTDEQTGLLLRTVASLSQQDNANEEEKGLVDKIKACVEKNICTFSVTKQVYAPQRWFYCYTCGLVDNEGVCESCINVCHKGHSISESRLSERFFCDCGASGSCQCLENSTEE